MKKRRFTKPQKIGLWMIITATALVLFAVFVNAFFHSSKIVENRLQFLAKTYYEDYYYDEITNNGAYTDVFTEYDESGLPKVNLSQLLAFDNHKYANFESDFINDRYDCDLTKTFVKYFPASPYGRQDYTVKYNYSCSNMTTAS